MEERLEFEKALFGEEDARYYEWLRKCAVEDAMLTIKRYCESHPTCKGCKYRKEHIGCEFRGKSPREWKI